MTISEDDSNYRKKDPASDASSDLGPANPTPQSAEMKTEKEKWEWGLYVGKVCRNRYLFDLEELSEDQLPEKERELRRSLIEKPDDPTTRIVLARLLHEKFKQLSEAEELYQISVEVHPEVSMAWLWYGDLLNEYYGQKDEAESAYRNATKYNPQCWISWWTLARFLRSRDKLDDAAEAYEKALCIDNDPMMLGICEEMAEFYEMMGNYQKAIENWLTVFWYGGEYEALAKIENCLSGRKYIIQDVAAEFKNTGENLLYESSYIELTEFLMYRIEYASLAEEVCNAGVHRYPKSYQLWTLLGDILDQLPSREEQAESARMRALDLLTPSDLALNETDEEGDTDGG